MTQIKIEVPANDHIVLNAFAEALQRIAAERAPSTSEYHCEAPVGVDGKPLTPPQRAEVSGHGEVTKEALEALVKISDETPKGDDYIEQVIDETHAKFAESSVGLTPTSGDVVIDALDKERTDTAWQEMDKAYAQHVESLPEGIKQGEPCTQGDIDKLEVTLTNDTLDADGIPHDKRIHSKGATRLADDTWRLKRKPADKTDEEWDEHVKSVKAELKAVQDIPVPSTLDEQAIADLTPPVIDEPVAPVTPPTSLAPEPVVEATRAIEIEEIEQAEVNAGTLTPPVAPVTPPTNLTPPETVQCTGKVTPVMRVPVNHPSVTTFQELMLYITSNAKKRGADNDMIRETLLEVDPALTAIPLIATRADLIPKFVTALEAKLS